MSVPIYWNCPYCGKPNKQRISILETQSVIGYCDCDDGGCDARSVIDIRVEFNVKAHCIEGEKPDLSQVKPEKEEV